MLGMQGTLEKPASYTMATEKEANEGTVGDVFVAEVLGESPEELEFIGFEGIV